MYMCQYFFSKEGRTIRSPADEHGVCKAAISNWIKECREECQENKEAEKEYDIMKENLRLRKELAESKKEVAFLKKAAAFFAKEIE